MYFLLTYDLELKQAILVRSFNLKNFTIDFNKGEEAKHLLSVGAVGRARHKYLGNGIGKYLQGGVRCTSRALGNFNILGTS